MPTYTYKARDTSGKRVEGAMEAVSKAELTDKLHKLGYMVTQIKETLPLPGLKMFSMLDRFQLIHTEDMVMFNVQLSNLLRAGIPLLASLHTLIHQIENKRLKQTVSSVARSVEAGESLSSGLQYHPQIFPKLFANMVKVGEASGKLDAVLSRYAEYCEQQADLNQKIQGALLYPLILLAAGIAVTLFIVTAIIPQFAEIFMKFGIRLPLPTLILYHVGVTIKQFWHTLILFVLVGWLSLQYYAGTTNGRLHVDRFKLSVPVLGSLFRRAAISRFGRTFGMLVGSGVPILQSLEIVRDTVGNEVLARVVTQAQEAVEKGEKISEPIRISGEFPPDTVQMIAVGEETGKLDEMLNKMADFYDRAVSYSVKKLTTLLEPLLMVMMGCLIGFIMASLLLPMFDMIKILRHR